MSKKCKTQAGNTARRQSSAILSANRLAMAPAHYLAIDLDGSLKLSIVIIEPLDFMGHRANQLDQPLVFLKRTHDVLNICGRNFFRWNMSRPHFFPLCEDLPGTHAKNIAFSCNASRALKAIV